MKIAILFCLVAAASAGHTFLGAAPGLAGYHAASTGESVVQRQEDGIGNYAFSVAEQGATGGTSQQEAGDVYGRKQGSYSLGVVDGRARKVDWVADEFGFRARVSTNEPGTAPSNPADVLIDSAAQGHVAHVAPAQVAAPIAVPRPIVQHAIAAPVAYPRPIVQQVAAPVLAHTKVVAPIAQPIVHQAPIVQHAIAAPVTKVVAQPYAHQALLAPQPVGYSSHVSHAAPLAYSRPTFASVAPQVLAQPIVQQQIIAAPRPVGYSSVVAHAAPVSAGLIAKPAYSLGLGLNYATGVVAKPALGLNYAALGGYYGHGLPLNYGLGLNGIGLGLAPYWK